MDPTLGGLEVIGLDNKFREVFIIMRGDMPRNTFEHDDSLNYIGQFSEEAGEEADEE